MAGHFTELHENWDVYQANQNTAQFLLHSTMDKAQNAQQMLLFSSYRGNWVNDCLVSYFCGLCTLIQETLVNAFFKFTKKTGPV